MKHHFYNIVVESEDGTTEYSVENQYVLDLPENSMENAIDRQEYLGIMFDSLVSASGLNVCSFASDPVTAE